MARRFHLNRFVMVVLSIILIAIYFAVSYANPNYGYYIAFAALTTMILIGLGYILFEIIWKDDEDEDDEYY